MSQVLLLSLLSLFFFSCRPYRSDLDFTNDSQGSFLTQLEKPFHGTNGQASNASWPKMPRRDYGATYQEVEQVTYNFAVTTSVEGKGVIFGGSASAKTGVAWPIEKTTYITSMLLATNDDEVGETVFIGGSGKGNPKGSLIAMSEGRDMKILCAKGIQYKSLAEGLSPETVVIVGGEVSGEAGIEIPIINVGGKVKMLASGDRTVRDGEYNLATVVQWSQFFQIKEGMRMQDVIQTCVDRFSGEKSKASFEIDAGEMLGSVSITDKVSTCTEDADCNKQFPTAKPKTVLRCAETSPIKGLAKQCMRRGLAGAQCAIYDEPAAFKNAKSGIVNVNGLSRGIRRRITLNEIPEYDCDRGFICTFDTEPVWGALGFTYWNSVFGGSATCKKQ